MENWIKNRPELFFYSPYSFIREISEKTHLESILLPQLQNPDFLHKKFVFEGYEYVFVSQFLAWDTAFFKAKTYKLLFVLFENKKFLDKAVLAYKTYLKTELQADYCFIEVPSEDTAVLQALSQNGFALIETRLTYFRSDLQNFDYQRFGVRKAELSDIPNLEKVASQMRNIYDRFHADNFFSQEIADRFLSEYVAQAVRGFSDVVLVPHEKNVPPDGFLSGNYLKKDWEKLGVKISKMVLSAVAPTCKGWYIKLISELTYHLKEQGADYIFMNTQSTNRAVFRTWEKLGYQLGSTTHILASR